MNSSIPLGGRLILPDLGEPCLSHLFKYFFRGNCCIQCSCRILRSRCCDFLPISGGILPKGGSILLYLYGSIINVDGCCSKILSRLCSCSIRNTFFGLVLCSAFSSVLRKYNVQPPAVSMLMVVSSKPSVSPVVTWAPGKPGALSLF